MNDIAYTEKFVDLLMFWFLCGFLAVVFEGIAFYISKRKQKEITITFGYICIAIVSIPLGPLSLLVGLFVLLIMLAEKKIIVIKLKKD